MTWTSRTFAPTLVSWVTVFGVALVVIGPAAAQAPSATTVSPGATVSPAMTASPAAPATSDPPAPVGSAASRQARGTAAAKAFLHGHYKEALAIYVDLYVQSNGRPEYLRNVGRCQQKLNQYDRAIDSFKEYLRLGKRLSADERSEVQGFIAEMEAARGSGAPSATGAGPTPVAPAAAVPPSGAPSPRDVSPASSLAAASPPVTNPSPVGGAEPAVAVPSALTPSLPPPALVTPPPPPAPHRTSRVKIGGIVAMAAAGALVAGGTIALFSSRHTFEEAKDMGCPSDSMLTCSTKADSVNTAIHVSQLLYLAGSVVGAAGLTMFLVAPSGGSDTRVALGVRAPF